MLTASKCKQELGRENGVQLLEKVNTFAEIFWTTKEVSTIKKKSLNPPNLELIVPE